MAEISIIVPTHNSQKYIRECLEHLISQSFSDIEILCIDSSSDNTQNIIEQYAGEDARIRFIPDKNNSYGHKLNRGFAEARGNYITFCDSDDYYSDEMIEVLYNEIKNKDVDFVKCNFIGFAEFPGYTYKVRRLRSQKKDIYEKVLEVSGQLEYRYLVGRNIWTGLYRRDFILRNHIILNESEGASFQDTGFGIFSAAYAERISFIEKCLYYYRLDNSGSSVKANNKYRCICQEMSWIKEQMQTRNLWDEEFQALYYKYALDSYLWNMHRLPADYQVKFREVLREEIERDYSGNPVFLKKATGAQMDQIEYLKGNPGMIEAYESQIEKTGKNMKIVEELFYSGTPTVLFGIGNFGREVLSLQAILQKHAIVAVCDNEKGKWGSKIEGYEVKSPEAAVRENAEAVYLTASRQHSEDMKEQLRKYGIPDSRIILIPDFPMNGQMLEMLAH